MFSRLYAFPSSIRMEVLLFSVETGWLLHHGVREASRGRGILLASCRLLRLKGARYVAGAGLKRLRVAASMEDGRLGSICFLTSSRCVSLTVSQSFVWTEHNREYRSATILSGPGMCSTSKSNCWMSTFHLNTLSDAFMFTYRRFLWSVRSVNLTSLYKYPPK
jgi:hypothetical protein